MFNQVSIRFSNLRHINTKKKDERAFELIIQAEFDDKLKQKYKTNTAEQEIWISVDCYSPGNYLYGFDGTDEKIQDEKLNQEEIRTLNHYLSKTNLIIEEAEILGIELDEEDNYHWGLN